MQKRDTNRTNMIRATLTWCTDNSAATASIPMFAPTKATVENKLILIDQLTQIDLSGTKGVTLDTLNIRKSMQNIAYKCACAVAAYAATQKNNTLRAKVNYSLNTMGAKKKEEIDDICQTIHNEAIANLPQATGFGYTNTDITDLQTAINLYRQSVQNPRQAIIKRKVAKQTLRTLINEIKDTLFKQVMDPMAQTLLLSNPNFVSGYFKAREIIDLGTTHTRVAGTVTVQNGTPINNATVRAVRASLADAPSDSDTIQIKTDHQGKYSIPKFPPGEYTFQWLHPNYQPQTETNIHIRPGKEHKRKITLLPL